MLINDMTSSDLSLVGCYDKSIMLPEERDKLMLLSAKNNLKKMAFFGLTELQETSQYVFEETFNLKYVNSIVHIRLVWFIKQPYQYR